MARGSRHIYRHCGSVTLEALFAAAGAEGAEIAPDLSPTRRADAAQAAFATLPKAIQAKLQAVLTEIGVLASPLGEDCLRQAAGVERARFNAKFVELNSCCERAAWARLNFPAMFEAARALWFFERRSTSATLADAFAGQDAFQVANDLAALQARIAAIIAEDIGAEALVQVDRYDMDDGAVLLAISHQELWRTEDEFTEAGALGARAGRPVQHAAAKIESGIITIAAERGGAARRAALAHAVAAEVLGLHGELSRLAPLSFSLNRLLDPAPFQVDKAHLITDVLVTALGLAAPSVGDALIEVFESGRSARDVRERALRLLPLSDRAVAMVVSGELRVVFAPGPGRARQRSVRLVFGGAAGCKFQLDCVEEALVRSYLKSWGLIASHRVAGPGR
ncbi:MAG: hypothetical protein ABL883_11140 [Terricaulis sp.]